MSCLAVSTTVRVSYTIDCTGGSISDNSPYFVFLSFSVLKNLSVMFTFITCLCAVLYFFIFVSLALSSLLMVSSIVFLCLRVCSSRSSFFPYFSFYFLSTTFSVSSVFLSSFPLIFFYFFLVSVLFSFYAGKKIPPIASVLEILA